MIKLLQIHHTDTVGVSLVGIAQGESVEYDSNGQTKTITALENIDKGHKISLIDHKSGMDVIKYGQSIGQTTTDVAAGAHIHSHNLKTNLNDIIEYSYNPIKSDAAQENVEIPKINVYTRANGDIGIRNDIAIIPLVGCVNGIIDEITDEFKSENTMPDDCNIVKLPHAYGCSQLGVDHINTRTILQNLVKHPNYGGVLVIALGCENNQMSEFQATLGDYDQSRVRFMIAQEHDDEVSHAKILLSELVQVVQQDKRSEQPVSKLRVGLKCGGSDGFSGVSANPLVGAFSDWLVARGGTTVLCEVPEMFGAEQLLMNRAVNQEVYEKTVKLINGFKEYFIQSKMPIYENPSPGNKAGGISTLEDKSLGCTQKAGHIGIVQDVLFYGEMLKKPGLNLLETPGNDIVSVSAMAASGCHVILFTTGRGTPLGGPVPTLKIATNNDIYTKKTRWFDFNAGTVLSGQTMNDVCSDLTTKIINVANGERATHEKLNKYDFTIFKTGITL